MDNKTNNVIKFEPHTPELEKDILLGIVDQVIVSTIDLEGNISDKCYNDFQFPYVRQKSSAIFAEHKETNIFELVSWLIGDEGNCLGDVFRNYDGKIYYFSDEGKYLEKSKSVLTRDEPGANNFHHEIVVVTAYHSKILHNKPNGEFKYFRSLDRKYEDTLKNINSVEFCISRYGSHEYTLQFDQPMGLRSQEHRQGPKTEKGAIRAVEEFLSYPLTKRYYDYISDDQLHILPWNEATARYKCRGDCIRGAIFIESTKLVDGHLSLGVGS